MIYWLLMIGNVWVAIAGAADGNVWLPLANGFCAGFMFACGAENFSRRLLP